MLAPPETAIRESGLRAGLVIAISTLLAVVVFSGALGEVITRWIKQDEYSHGFFIPLIAAWLIWSRRRALVAGLGQPSWAGPALIALALVVHLTGELSAIFILSQVSFVITLIGIVLGVGGYPLLRLTLAPILFLLFAIPVPYFLEAVLTWRLQLVSSELGVLVIRLFQIPVYLEGNIIDLGNYQVQVVEACSGLRYLYPLLSLGFLAAYFFKAPVWQRVIVFLSTIPITIVMNSFRIGMVGVLVNTWGTQMADGALHFFEGWVIFVVCAVLLVAEMHLFARLTSGRSFFEAFAVPQVFAIQSYRVGGGPARRFPATAGLVLLLVGGVTIAQLSGRQEIIPERARFISFPNALGDWHGQVSLLEPQVEHGLGLEDYILSDYSRASGGAVNLYVAYYATQRKGVSPHSPIVCMPGGGWRITRFERTTYADRKGGKSFPVNRAVIERNSTKQVVYYWFVQRGRIIANEYVSKWYLFADAILENRTDGALVRVTSPVYPGETERDADERLSSFVGELTPRLTTYLPGQPPATVSSRSGPSRG